MKIYIEKIRTFFINYWKWLILFSCVIGFLLIAKSVFSKEIVSMDVIVHDFISTYFVSDFVSQIIKFITNFGGAFFLSLMTIFLLIVIKNKKIGFSIVINIIIITILNMLLKNILQRPRPMEYNIINESGYSFPSGHSMVSMAFYGYLIYLIYKYVDNKYIRWFLIISLSILISIIGLSRVYLGVHYISDVLAGFLLAIAYLIVFTKILKKWITVRIKIITLTSKYILCI